MTDSAGRDPQHRTDQRPRGAPGPRRRRGSSSTRPRERRVPRGTSGTPPSHPRRGRSPAAPRRGRHAPSAASSTSSPRTVVEAPDRGQHVRPHEEARTERHGRARRPGPAIPLASTGHHVADRGELLVGPLDRMEGLHRQESVRSEPGGRRPGGRRHRGPARCRRPGTGGARHGPRPLPGGRPRACPASRAAANPTRRRRTPRPGRRPPCDRRSHRRPPAPRAGARSGPATTRAGEGGCAPRCGRGSRRTPTRPARTRSWREGCAPATAAPRRPTNRRPPRRWQLCVTREEASSGRRGSPCARWARSLGG